MSKEKPRKTKLVDRVITITILGAGMGFGVMCLLFLSSGQLSPGRPGCCTDPYSGTLHLFSFALLVGSVLVGFLRWRLWPWLRSGSQRFSSGAPRATDAPRTAAPAYAWTCHVCATSNQPGHDKCRSCGNTASISMSGAASARSELAADRAVDTSHKTPNNP